MTELEVLIQIMAFMEENKDSDYSEILQLISDNQVLILQQNEFMKSALLAILGILGMIIAILCICFAIYLSRWFFKVVVSDAIFKNI